ncbi:uncharacterized protein LOC131599644 isoform X1 [Vicia villosa]|uniref:uncharacterized protein LOC131599644 isoform X1 n=1 Tax=Vicia villosa TaxID=3911 RepID=UPI00273C484E|nr:uncharacterized protein LOC131599644 isoform X1 [Vicia villosa]
MYSVALLPCRTAAVKPPNHEVAIWPSATGKNRFKVTENCIHIQYLNPFSNNSVPFLTTMFNFNRLTPLSPNPNPLLHRYPSLFSLHFSTNTSDSTSSTVSDSKPDSVLNFFKNHGFSDSQLHSMIARVPGLLSYNPSKRILPKFQFLLSKGASNSDIVNLVSKNPRVLSPSLENHIVPTYELIYRFLQSDKNVIASAIQSPVLLFDHRVPRNIAMLIENGVSDSNIARMLRIWSRIFSERDTLKFVEEVKNLGFNPSKTVFSIALIAKTSVSKNLWEEKVEVFKKWGWSDEDALEAFRKNPYCMLTSVDKINLVMSFWVNQLGWGAMALTKAPYILSSSLEKRIIPRAAVVQYLLDKGLRNKSASLTSPFVVSEKMFLDKFIKRFKKESSYLLKLYEEKLINPAYTRNDKTCMP